MKKSMRKIIAFVFSLCFLIAFGTFGTQTVQATSGGYTIKPGGTSTDNVNIDNGSYLVKGNPGQTVDLKLIVLNQESKTRKFMYTVNTAYTSDGGVLSYNKSKVTDPSLKVQVKDTATPQKSEFQVPGNTTATLTFKITIPKKSFDGYIMGGVSVSPYGEKAKGTVSSNGTLLKNKFSYSIPIQINQTGKDSVEAKYSITSVKPGVMSGKPNVGILANVHNSTNSYTGGLSSKAVVTKKGNKDFKITTTADDQNIAPTSNYNYSISWGKKQLQSGNYHLKLTYKAQGGLKSWTLNKDFTITNNDAAKYNKLAGIKPNYLWLYILLAVLALAIILGLGIYLGRRNNNKNNNGNNGNNGNNNSGNTTRRRRR
ncbi:WxL protein host-binding domain-containing protein [Companilactobacillus huachuanensis]|uniref:WxL protein host-binding domain-containing protein n=1 Tax=Companilactobacillus huachuanensis TaxID=2559914 RepID=A0ABW1RMU2_9LACO|nr:DUF3324 domain-containing protein [Companilactobacillus huachuanensis]